MNHPWNLQVYGILTVSWKQLHIQWIKTYVTGICVSQGCVFPTHISLGMRVSPCTHISLKQQLATSHRDMCVLGKCVSPEILLNFTSSLQFEPKANSFQILHVCLGMY